MIRDDGGGRMLQQGMTKPHGVEYVEITVIGIRSAT